MLTRPKSILPFQIARDETGSWRALERRLAVERRRIEVFRAILSHQSIRITSGFSDFWLYNSSRDEDALWPLGLEHFASPGRFAVDFVASVVVEPFDSEITGALSSHLTLGFGWRRDFLKGFSGQISVADMNCNIG